MERNPYFFAVDADGKQLPYVEDITHRLFETNDVFDLRITNRVIDFQARRVNRLRVNAMTTTTGGARDRLTIPPRGRCNSGHRGPATVLARSSASEKNQMRRKTMEEERTLERRITELAEKMGWEWVLVATMLVGEEYDYFGAPDGILPSEEMAREVFAQIGEENRCQLLSKALRMLKYDARIGEGGSRRKPGRSPFARLATNLDMERDDMATVLDPVLRASNRRGMSAATWLLQAIGEKLSAERENKKSDEDKDVRNDDRGDYIVQVRLDRLEYAASLGVASRTPESVSAWARRTLQRELLKEEGSR